MDLDVLMNSEVAMKSLNRREMIRHAGVFSIATAMNASASMEVDAVSPSQFARIQGRKPFRLLRQLKSPT